MTLVRLLRRRQPECSKTLTTVAEFAIQDGVILIPKRLRR